MSDDSPRPAYWCELCQSFHEPEDADSKIAPAWIVVNRGEGERREPAPWCQWRFSQMSLDAQAARAEEYRHNRRSEATSERQAASLHVIARLLLRAVREARE